MRITAPPLNALEMQQLERPEPTTPGTRPPDFASEIAGFISQVEGQQRVAEQESTKLAAGGGNVHETALALEKADIEMRLLMKGRNKILEAYQEIARMPV